MYHHLNGRVNNKEISVIYFIIHCRSLTSPFTRLTPPGSYRATTCREREFTLDHIHTFLTIQGQGGPPRMRDQLNAGATSETTQSWKTIHTIHTHPFILTRGIWTDDYDGQMISGNHWGLKLPNICLTDEEKPWKKNFTQETCLERGSNPDLLRDSCTCYRLLHSGGHSLF